MSVSAPNALLWDSPGTWNCDASNCTIPGPNDDVELAFEKCAPSEKTRYVLMSKDASCKTISIVATTNCQSLLLIRGVTLTVTGMTIGKYGVLMMANQASKLVCTVAMRLSEHGVITGTGLVEAGKWNTAGFGHIAPGVWVRDFICRDCQPITLQYSQSTGNLTIKTAEIELSRIQVWIKRYYTTQPVLDEFDRLIFDAVVTTTQQEENPLRILVDTIEDVNANNNLDPIDAISVGGVLQPFNFTLVNLARDSFPWQPECQITSNECSEQQSSSSSGTPPIACGTQSGLSILVNSGEEQCTTGPGQNDVTCDTIPQLMCQNGGVCENLVVGRQCKCYTQVRNGRIFKSRGQFCEILDCPSDCSGATHGDCVFAKNQVQCQCEASWSGDICASPTCLPNCENGGICLPTNPTTCNCSSGWQGESCDQVLLQGSCPICENSGNCTAEFTCACPTGYSGSTCMILGCLRDCLGNGICLAGLKGAFPQCNCEENWSGNDCGTRACVSSSCQNDGACVIDGANEVTCECTVGFTGQDCSVTLSGEEETTPATAASVPIGAIIGAVVGGLILAVGCAIGIRAWHLHRVKVFTKRANADILLSNNPSFQTVP